MMCLKTQTLQAALEREQLFDWNPYEDWELVHQEGGASAVKCRIALRVPPKEEAWLYQYLQQHTSREIPLTTFRAQAPKAFADIQCLHLKKTDPFRVQTIPESAYPNWLIRIPNLIITEMVEAG